MKMKIKTTKNKISPFSLCSLLRLEKDPSLALHLFQNPNPNQKKPFKYTLLAYDLIITKLGRAKMFQQMEQILGQLKQDAATRFPVKEIIFCNVIAFYGRARMPNHAFKVYDEIPSYNCARTVKSLNSLLNAFLNCKKFDLMWDVFAAAVVDDDDDQRVVELDACTYNIWINACCLKGDLSSAWKVFDEMRERGVAPNEVTFGTLIRGLCTNQKLDEALRLKRVMEHKFDVKPTSYVYASLIKGLCEAQELEKAFMLKDEMLRTEVKLDSAIYTTFISGLFKAGRKGEVDGVLSEMRKNGCKPDTATYNAMIAGHCRASDFEAAYQVLDEMPKNDCKPDVVSYNVIIGGLCKDGKLEEANDLFLDMPRRGCVPDVVSYRILFDGFCGDKQFKGAAVILDEMVFKGYVPRTKRVYEFVEGLCNEGNVDLLWSVLNILVKGSLIDVETWRLALSVVCKKDRVLDSCQLLDALIMFSANTEMMLADGMISLLEVMIANSNSHHRSATALYLTLSCLDEAKPIIASSKAVPFLISLLGIENNQQCRHDSLSSSPSGIKNLLSGGIVNSLSSLLTLVNDLKWTKRSIAVLLNIAATKERKDEMVSNPDLITRLATILDAGGSVEQEQAVSCLLTLCIGNDNCSQMVLQEEVIPSLVSISVNGTMRGKEKAQKLMMLFREQRQRSSSTLVIVDHQQRRD